MLRSYLCDYCDAYIVVKATINVKASNDANKNKRTLRTILRLDHAYQ